MLTNTQSTDRLRTHLPAENIVGPGATEPSAAWLHRLARARLDESPARALARYPATSRRNNCQFHSLEVICASLRAYASADVYGSSQKSSAGDLYSRVHYYLSSFAFGGYEAAAALHAGTFAQRITEVWPQASRAHGSSEAIGRTHPSLAPFVAYLDLMATGARSLSALQEASRQRKLTPPVSHGMLRSQLRPLMSVICDQGLEAGATMASMLLAGAKQSATLLTRQTQAEAGRALAEARPPQPDPRPLAGPSRARSPATQRPLVPELGLVPPRADRPLPASPTVRHGAKRPALEVLDLTDDDACAASDTAQAPTYVPKRVCLEARQRPVHTFSFERQGVAMTLALADARTVFGPQSGADVDGYKQVQINCNDLAAALSVTTIQALLRLHPPSTGEDVDATRISALRSHGLPISHNNSQLILFRDDWLQILAEEPAEPRPRAPVELLFNGHYLHSDVLSLRNLHA